MLNSHGWVLFINSITHMIDWLSFKQFMKKQKNFGIIPVINLKNSEDSAYFFQSDLCHKSFFILFF